MLISVANLSILLSNRTIFSESTLSDSDTEVTAFTGVGVNTSISFWLFPSIFFNFEKILILLSVDCDCDCDCDCWCESSNNFILIKLLSSLNPFSSDQEIIFFGIDSKSLYLFCCNTISSLTTLCLGISSFIFIDFIIVLIFDSFFSIGELKYCSHSFESLISKPLSFFIPLFMVLLLLLSLFL